VDEKIVWYALDQLGHDRLLEERPTLPVPLAGMTRRQHLRAIGKAAAVAVPLVTAVIAPRPAAAATKFPNGHSCTASNQCLNGCCCANNSGGHINTCQNIGGCGGNNACF